MTKPNVGILHPGEMGVSIAASILNGGHPVYWVSAGRGAQTAARAQKHGLIDADSLERLCASCAAIVSVCPPHAAEDVAQQAAACGFAGLYIDANAIAPARARRIGQVVAQSGAQFVDGGIIGPPAWKAGTTRLYLSGPAAGVAAGLFAQPLEVCVLGDSPDAASALKMCYAAYTKGTTALLCAILASAETLGVRSDLERQWAQDRSGLAEKATQQVRTVPAKAWRFVGEMEEIAATLEAAGMPGGFHMAAAEVYRRIAHLKDAPSTPELEEVMAALTRVPKEDEVMAR
jgi:3-hydroxyisobutyrate dehydrogenase-like beta-hydroxyacid dehydrogenase